MNIAKLTQLSAVWLLLTIHNTTACNENLSNSSSVKRTVRVTAYCPCSKCCGKWADGRTATNKPVTYNKGKFIAMDKSIPFGTLVFIPSYSPKPVPVEDRGGAIKGDKIDVFFPTHQEALNWGVKIIEVTIYRKGKK